MAIELLLLLYPRANRVILVYLVNDDNSIFVHLLSAEDSETLDVSKAYVWGCDRVREQVLLVAKALHVFWNELNNLLAREHDVCPLTLHRLRVRYFFPFVFCDEDAFNLRVRTHYSERVASLNHELPVQLEEVVDRIAQFLSL